LPGDEDGLPRDEDGSPRDEDALPRDDDALLRDEVAAALAPEDPLLPLALPRGADEAFPALVGAPLRAVAPLARLAPCLASAMGHLRGWIGLGLLGIAPAPGEPLQELIGARLLLLFAYQPDIAVEL
jgi:hypothetical protein